MVIKTLIQLLAGALLVALTAGGQNQSLGDLLKGGVKRGGTAPQPAPQQPAPQQSAPPQQQPAPQQPEPPQQNEPNPSMPPRPGAPEAAVAANTGAFKMQLPPGWRAELTQNQAVVARSGDQASAVVIAPVMAPQHVSAEDYLRNYAALGLRGWFPNASVVRVARSRSGASKALASLDYRSGNGPGRAAALLFMSGGLGTLYVIGSPAGTFHQQQGALIQILRSFSFEGQADPKRAAGGPQRPAAPAMNYTRFSDPLEGAFTCDVPAGWKTSGGMARKSSIDTRGFVRVTSPDGAINIFAGDPDIGTFTLPNQMLQMTGFREGSVYSPGYGNSMIVRRYVPGLQFAQEYAGRFAQSIGATAVQQRDARPRPDLSGERSNMAKETWTSGEFSFGCNIRGTEGAGYVLATTKLTTIFETALWNVTMLVGFAAPVNQVSTAGAALKHMMESFRINPNWAARQQQLTKQTSAIVSETHEFVSKTINDSYWSRQRSMDRINENFSDYIRGRVRLRDPDTGEDLEGRAGNNYYWRVRGTDTIIGKDTYDPPPNIDVTELEQIG